MRYDLFAHGNIASFDKEYANEFLAYLSLLCYSKKRKYPAVAERLMQRTVNPSQVGSTPTRRKNISYFRVGGEGNVGDIPRDLPLANRLLPAGKIFHIFG